MDKIRVIGGAPLHGTIDISGAKNAALPLMAACLLSEEELTLTNVPHLMDITTMANLLVHLGVDLSIDGSIDKRSSSGGRVLRLHGGGVHSTLAPYDMVRKMRASVVVLGPLLARFGEATVSLPGGCAIGTRPIDQHIKGLEAMGAEIHLEEGYIHAKAPKGLMGAEIHFPFVSVGATENVMMAATLAKGTTVIHNAAREPEVIDLGHCLEAMGAKMEGLGTETLTIEGQSTLTKATHDVIADRIEAGTYAIAAAITGGELKLNGVREEMMTSSIDALKDAGVEIVSSENAIICKSSGEIKPLELVTAPYPGFATDMQAQFMALMCFASGVSTIKETIFENRYMHVPELTRMGAKIKTDGNLAIVEGTSTLKGAQVMATDLRASVSLVLAALAAEGETIINRVYHIDRGYEHIEHKLSACGADIRRIKGEEE